MENAIKHLKLENEKLKDTLCNLLTGINFNKPNLPIDIELVEPYVLNELKNMEKLIKSVEHSPIICEVLRSYQKQYTELGYHFIQDVNDAILRQAVADSQIDKLLG